MKKLNSKKGPKFGKVESYGGMPQEQSIPSEAPEKANMENSKSLKTFAPESLNKMNGVPNEDPKTPEPKKPKLLRFDAPGCKYDLE